MTLSLGLIRWGIVIHAFIDGHSRVITSIRASNNNRALTVLDVFHDGVRGWGLPSRVRGDHGTENIQVAAYMNYYRGSQQGSYLWGRCEFQTPYGTTFQPHTSWIRSVHNTRIERLWVDLKVQLVSKWANFFTDLELRC